MTIYVDPLVNRGRKWTRKGHTHSCHMGTDQHTQRGLSELCEFAHELGLRDAWFQWGGVGNRVPHFDLTDGKRKAAVLRGAVQVSSRELLAKCKWTGEELEAAAHQDGAGRA